MKRLAVFALLFTLVASTPAYAQHLQFGRIKVYTRNLYIGADFDPVLAALQDPGSLSSVAQAGHCQVVGGETLHEANGYTTPVLPAS